MSFKNIHNCDPPPLPPSNTPALGVLKFTILLDLLDYKTSLDIITIYLMWLIHVPKIHYMTYMTMLQYKNPCHGELLHVYFEFTILVDSSLFII